MLFAENFTQPAKHSDPACATLFQEKMIIKRDRELRARQQLIEMQMREINRKNQELDVTFVHITLWPKRNKTKILLFSCFITTFSMLGKFSR